MRELVCRFILLPLLLGASCVPGEEDEESRPNFVLIFCDDLGYGDLGAYGNPTIQTPHLDRLAAEGQKWTSFYAAASVCTPSRAGLLTGRLPIRSGMCSDVRRVLFPDSGGGLPQSEITIAESLKALGYRTRAVGKWHLGHLPQFLPTEHGFDSYFGIPYSNDMDRTASAPPGRQAFEEPKSDYWNVPLMRNGEIVERPADQTTLTRRYTEEALAFIEENQESPFFLYLAHSMPHVPLFRSPEFEERSRRGLYGDVIEEIDWSTGQISERLRQLDLHERTLLVFTSDNGPWLIFDEQGGSAGLLRGGKGDTFEGGMREPAIFWMPGTIEPAVVADPATTMDLLPTFLSLAGGSPAGDRTYDGIDLSRVLKEKAPGTRDEVFYYRGSELYAMRLGAYKAHFVTRSGYGGEDPIRHNPPLLYNLEHDPGEKYDLAGEYPEVIERIEAAAAAHRRRIEPAPDQLAIPLGE